MEKENNNLNQEIHRKTREIYTLKNKILRYWKKLVAISLKVTKEKGIEVIMTDSYEEQINSSLENPKAIQVYKDGELVNANELIELSRNIAPSLYRRYNKSLRAYNLKISELESLVN